MRNGHGQECLGPGSAVQRVRSALRDRLYRFVRRLFGTDDGRRILAEALRGLVPDRPGPFRLGESPPAPYPELGRPQRGDGPASRRDVVFITGRFRSGSTLLWNLFRHVEGTTAYYEPFNERRWFDPKARGERMDHTHRNVSDYWSEYEGLEALSKSYREDWTERRFLMGPDAWAPGMKHFVETLIEKAPGRPVLQFNRIDFRLPWFRRHFPSAKIVHIYRHPRDQWCSTLLEDVARMPRELDPEAFAPYDKFYLRTWACDLKYHFPFLDERQVGHPYDLFYLIWRLSYHFGVAYSDDSVPFEALVEDSEAVLTRLFSHLDIRVPDLAALKPLIERPSLRRWSVYADDDWFASREAACEAVLSDFFLGGPTGALEPKPAESGRTVAPTSGPPSRTSRLGGNPSEVFPAPVGVDGFSESPGSHPGR